MDSFQEPGPSPGLGASSEKWLPWPAALACLRHLVKNPCFTSLIRFINTWEHLASSCSHHQLPINKQLLPGVTLVAQSHSSWQRKLQVIK